MLLYTSSSLGQCTDMLIIPLINYTVRGEIQSQRPLNIYLLDGYSPQSICCVSAPASLFRSSMCITWDKQRKQANKGAEHWLINKDKFKEAEDINCITLHSHSIKSFALRYPLMSTFINWIIPSGIVVLLSRLKYSMISLVWKIENIISVLFAVVNFRVAS